MSPFIKNKKATTYFLSRLVFFAVLLLASCSGAGSPTTDLASPASPADASITDDPLVEAPKVNSGAIVTPSFTSNPVPDEIVPETPSPEPDILPTVRPDLHATDPEGVTLASGRLQLIEFFAFW